jgi:hypothetical protein
MAKKQEIEILISEDGCIKFHIKGIKGPKCVELAKVMEKSLGKIKELSLTSEYYEKETTQQKTKVNK